MISNPEDFIFYSEFKYPPVVQSGTTPVASGDTSLKVMTGNITLDEDWDVYYQYTSGDGTQRIARSTTAYVDPSGNLVDMAILAPQTFIWRVYGY